MKVLRLFEAHKYIIGFLFLGVILIWWHIGNSTLTLDEVASIYISKDWHQLLNFLRYEEGNMWFYYLALHFWLKLGDAEFWVRSLSGTFGVLTIPLVYLFAKEIGGGRVARLATLLFLLNIYFIEYARQARGYSAALFFVTAGALVLYKSLNRGFGYWKVMILAVIYLGGIYNHMLAGLAIFAQLISAFWFYPEKEHRKKIIAVIIAIAIGLIPLVIAPSFRSHQVDWIQKPDLKQLIFGFMVISGDSIGATIVSGLFIIGYFLHIRKYLFGSSESRFNLLFLSVWVVFPILFGYIFSVFVKPVYEPESFNSSLSGFVVLLSLAINEKGKYMKIKQYGLTALFIFLGLRLILSYSGSEYMHYVFENKSTRDWQAVAKYIDKNVQEGDAIVYYAYYIKYPFRYYFSKYPPANTLQEVEISSKDYAIGGGTELPEPDIQKIDSLKAKYKRVWVLLSYNDSDHLKRKDQWLEMKEELTEHFNRKLSENYRNLHMELYVNKRNN